MQLSIALGRRGFFCMIIVAILAFGIHYYNACYDAAVHLYSISKPVRLYESYTYAPNIEHPSGDLLCYPQDPKIRTRLAPKRPHLCYRTQLPAPYLALACDFEAHDYCMGSTCNFWFEHVMQAAANNPESANTAAAKDPELSLKVINSMLISVEARFVTSLNHLSYVANANSSINRNWEKGTIEAALQTCQVLLWHCDESRARNLRSKEATWSTTYDLLSKMEKRLKQYSIEMRCWVKSVPLSASHHCRELKVVLDIFRMLLSEFQRRSKSGTATCPDKKRELQLDTYKG
ncbi:hypothetical protein AA0111_g2762 [Alternaria arborescens]|uniref:hypothetical protein n=1 Tax=Alternaria arborescens TaxID=156630 RepID=UPI001074DAD7|nr:hypothetical protein AA0111_g2762 [Alternaria arborescens]RYO36333.1 hypothetical protein AA0111_g2762 [Alternaria arborescens]